jgi:hypothetical protein
MFFFLILAFNLNLCYVQSLLILCGFGVTVLRIYSTGFCATDRRSVCVYHGCAQRWYQIWNKAILKEDISCIHVSVHTNPVLLRRENRPLICVVFEKHVYHVNWKLTVT